jgi:hypothetical protein
MSLARMTDSDLRRIVEAAINAEVTGTGPSLETIASIADGDEDIPILIANLASLRWLFWTTPEQGIAFLQIERELDQDDEALDEEERKALEG